MTEKQKEQFNRMRLSLLKISRSYMKPDTLRRVRDDGLEYPERLEMSYENIQAEAAWASKGVRQITKQ